MTTSLGHGKRSGCSCVKVWRSSSWDCKLVYTWLGWSAENRQIDAENYRQALTKTEGLLKELKQLDDKIILTEVFLLESRAAHAIQNLPRAKVRHISTVLCAARSRTGRIDVRSNHRKLDLLPSSSPSSARPSSRSRARRREGLQDGILVLLRSIRGSGAA